MCKFRLFRCCLVALLLMLGPPAFAQTPGGQTPAGDGQCDLLKAEGVTEGLYGLCVALCESQDYSGDVPMKESHNSILANYTELKKDNDPEMPCAASSTSDPAPVPPPVVHSCPCWSAAEADAVDGVLSDGSTAVGWPAPTTNATACSASLDNPYIQETDNASSPNEVSYIQVVDITSTFSSFHQCKYRKMVPGQPIGNVLLSVEFGTLTVEQLAACKADVLARQQALNVCQ